MQFAPITLELLTPLHIGAGRCGVLLRSHNFVPGHVIAYALAAAIGKHKGWQNQDFEKALKTINDNLRCGPFFIWDSEALLPHKDQQQIETHYLTATNHVTLHFDTSASVEGALFEVEAISARVLRGEKRGQPTQLKGGIWYKTEQLENQSLLEWLDQCWLGGERKTGFGRVQHVGELASESNYPGIPERRCDAEGVHLNAGDLLPGPALDGVIDVPRYPWLGRLYDDKKGKGFGRRFSEPALVRMGGNVKQNACFLPANTEKGFSCWKRQ
jgi:hypothetical protein